MANHYRVLGIEHTATADEIQDAYRSLAKKYHPDVSQLEDAEDRFIEITEAYEILSDPIKRNRYDLTRHSPSPRMAKARKQKAYEAYVHKQEQEAKKKAQAYAKQKYEKFDIDYFDSEAQYYLPKMLGCFGIAAVAGFIFITAIILVQGSDYAFITLFVLGMILLVGGAFGSTQFDMWHNARQKKRKMKRGK